MLVDDNAVVRRGLASVLDEEADIEVVGEAGDGREAVTMAAALQPDVVCLDVRMPVMDGLEAAAILSRSTRVLMLTYGEEERLVGGAIRAGAAGYLLHGRFEPDELATRIKEVAAGQTVLSPAVAPTVFEALRNTPEGEARGGNDDELTVRESEVMALLARGLSNGQIAGELVVTRKTVKNHLAHVYVKLGVHSRTEAVAAWLGIERGKD
jgi:DNA-binding NarL/FixJ family response regulator